MCDAMLKKFVFSAIVNRKIANFIAVSVKLGPFIAILCVCRSSSRNILIFLLDYEMKITHFTAVYISFTNFVCIACNVPCIRVLARLRYVSSFPDTFQPYCTDHLSITTTVTRSPGGRFGKVLL